MRAFLKPARGTSGIRRGMPAVARRATTDRGRRIARGRSLRVLRRGARRLRGVSSLTAERTQPDIPFLRPITNSAFQIPRSRDKHSSKETHSRRLRILQGDMICLRWKQTLIILTKPYIHMPTVTVSIKRHCLNRLDLAIWHFLMTSITTTIHFAETDTGFHDSAVVL